jgi:hypothetical protein
MKQRRNDWYSYRTSARLALTVLWILLALPLSAQVGGFSGADQDGDGLPDDFEQAILEKFRPTWIIAANDCNGLPAEFQANIIAPTVKLQNGTIYGQVFVRGSNGLGFFIEAHFYDLWAADCGFFNSHFLDAEHVSALIRAPDSSRPLTEWYATQWYAAAHQDTLCDSSQTASAVAVSAEDHGPSIWVAWGKHGAFFSRQQCNVGGCTADRCETSVVSLSPVPVNIGEVNAPLNGAVWTAAGTWPLADKMRTDFANFSTFSSLTYGLADPGGMSFVTTGSPLSTIVGYASIQSNAGSAIPSGVAIFAYRRNNVLVTEAGVPAAAPIRSGRIYAEVNGRANTGLAFVNPGNQPALISFFFTDSSGRDFGHSAISVPAKGLFGRFLNESPFNSGTLVRGTLTFNASTPVSVVALRGYTNERNEFLITTLPVSDLSMPVSRSVIFPHLADGDGWTTQIVLVNPTDSTMTGAIAFIEQGGTSGRAGPLELTLNGQPGSTLTYTIPPRSSWSGLTSGSGTAVRVGSARVTAANNSAIPYGVAIFSYRRNGIVVTESGVIATSEGAGFRLFAESSGNFNDPGSLQTGIAITNLSDEPANVTLQLTTLTGANIATGSLLLAGRGQRALFLNEVPGFSSLPVPFQGVLRVSTNAASGVSVIGLRGRNNERRDFLIATTPSVNESDVSVSSTESFFPYLAEGGGYTTQFILLSGQGRSPTGWVRFYSETGVTLNLSLR